MNEKEINEGYSYIIVLLKQRRLREALIQLEAVLYETNDWNLRSRLEEISTSYQYMLQYMKQGSNDPQRHILYQKLLCQVWEVAERGRLLLLDKVSHSYYHSLRNNRKNMPAGYNMGNWQHVLEAFSDEIAVCRLDPSNQTALEQVLKRHEDTNRYLFLTTWSNCDWTQEEDSYAHLYLTSREIPISDLSLFVSAVTLSLLSCFDLNKFYWLLDAYEHKNVHISQRALVGIAIVMHTYSDRLPYYPEINTRLMFLNERTSFAKELNRVYVQLLRSKETEKIDKKMREEIIPEMIKKVNQMRNLKYGMDETILDENDLNPDWEKAFETSGLGDKIREMNELQLEGSDVYMSSFSQLKKYPFFNEPHNWFYPFDPLHSSVVKVLGLSSKGDNPMLSMLLLSGFFCNSDKYSLCFIMSQIPAEQRSMMLNQMTQQDLNEMLEEGKTIPLQKYAERPEVVSNQYIHDLYRFYKLCQRRSEFRDIFKEEIALHRIPLLHSILFQADLLQEVADFHFQKEHYVEASEHYRELSGLQQNADLFQKMGYCLQKEKRYSEAIKFYHKADILKPDHLWTLRHLATCYRMNREYATALEYYKKIETVQPENRTVLFFIGTCLSEEGQFDEALQYFFKLDFLEENNHKAWRAIGWCSFVCGKMEQATKYYQRLLAERPLPTDYLNAGHVAWVSGLLEQAVEYYSKAIILGNSRETFLEMFEKDQDILIRKGIAEEDIPLVLDMIR